MSKYVLLALLVLVAVSLLAEARPNRGRWVAGRARHPTRGGDRTPRVAWRVRQFMRNFRLPHYKFGIGNPAFEFSINFGGKNHNWWDGPNVCETKTSDEPREITDDVSLDGNTQHHTYSVSEACDVTPTVYKCTHTKTMVGVGTTTTVVAKKCCAGFTRKGTDHGCPKEVHLLSLNDTAQGLRLQQFLETANSVNLTGKLVTGNFTVFAPTNEAFAEFGQGFDMGSVLVVSQSMVEKLTAKISGVMLGHMTSDVITTASMYDEQLIETLSPVNSKIRMNFYDNANIKVMLANCQRVTSADNMASNGVIHVVDKVLSPVTESIIDIISKDPNLSYLKTALGRTALSSSLREDGQFTIYAPTDAAFRQLDGDVLDRIFNHSACLKKVLQNHILPNVICSTAVQGRSRTKNLLNNYLSLTRDEDDKLFVQNHQVVASDIMATNGVIHLIDHVLFMDIAMDVLDIVSNKVPVLLDLVRLAGLEENLRDAEDITIFAPTKEALSKIDPAMLNSLMNDTSALIDFLTYHVTSGVHQTKMFYNDQRLNTLNDGEQIRINKYSETRHESAGMAQCVPIVSSSARICNGVVHFVDKVLTPPSGSIMHILRHDSRFSRFVELIQQTKMVQALDENDPLTVLALTNEAFNNLPEYIADALRNNNTRQIEKLIYSNIIQTTICCKAIQSWFFTGRSYVRPLVGKALALKSMYGTTSIGRATVTECDLTATNGVIQVVNGFANSLDSWHFSWWGFR